ncbi:MAG TPA: glycosyltransferase family 4 protein [Nitriliruptorales bacterium]
MTRPLRIALLTYRGHPYVGGQGVYVRNLSRELVRRGHQVEVVSGQPYPVLDDGVVLHELPSLDLYDPVRPFRRPARDEYRDTVDVVERAIMLTGGYPEPLTFSLRAHRWLREHRDRFDLVHDNQTLGYGLLGIPALGLPVVETIHHPITVDRRIEVAAAPTRGRRMGVRRWYGFVGMQGRVARRLRHIVTVSEQSRADLIRELGIRPERLDVTHVGVDPSTFRPRPDVARVPGRIVTTASSDSTLKGGRVLVEAVARLRCQRDDLELCFVGRPRAGGPLEQAIDRLGLATTVSFHSGIRDEELVRLLASASVAVVPSLYEGFCLPAAEAMACGTPLVASRAGALPEVVGSDGQAGLLVPPGDPDALAAALGRVLDDEVLARRLGTTAHHRVLARFTWDRTAAATEAVYTRALGLPTAAGRPTAVLAAER